MPRKSHPSINTQTLWIVPLAVLCLVFVALRSDGAVHDRVERKREYDRELIVKFRQGADAQQKTRALRNAEVVKPLSIQRQMRAAGLAGAPATVVRVRVRNGLEMDGELARLQGNPAVEYAELNYPIKIREATNAPVIPNDFEFSQMYALNNLGLGNATTNADVNAPEAWSFTTGSKSVVVAVVDTGIDYFHDDLKENLWSNPGEIANNGLDDDRNGFVDDVIGYDFVWNDSDPFDDNQHGTHVSGTIGAKGNNGIGTVGVCWNVSLMSLKAFDENGNGTVGDAIEAIAYAVANGARIINASWGLNEKSRALEDACKAAAESGVLIVAAAGNDQSEAPSYPASFETVLSVGATDAKDARAVFSNYGTYVDVAAPGQDILSTLPENSYGMLSGTSMAAPHVAGTAALVLSRFPIYTREELFDIVVNSIDVITVDLPIGNGRINASTAVQMDQPLPTARLKVNDSISGFVDVTGFASGTFFSGYALNIGAGRTPSEWITVASSATPVTNAFLGRFDSALVPDGNAVVQLVVSNSNGAAAVASARVRVFNALISAPLSGDVLAPGRYTVRGTVHGAGKEYELFYGAGLKPTSWTKFAEGGTGKIDAILGEWNASELETGYYALKLEVKEKGNRSEFSAPLVYIERKMKEGWPRYVETDADFPATEWRNIRPVDLDGNGLVEVVMVDPGTRFRKQKLRVYEFDGYEAWTRELGYDIAPDLPAIGDINGDGKKEIFVDGTNGIVAYGYDGIVLPGWPVETGSANHAKVLGDLDGDGAPELIAYSQEYAATQVMESRELFVFKQDGTLLQKWTLPWCGFTNDVQKIFPVAVNLDDDAALELVVPSGCSELLAFDLESATPKWSAAVTGKILSSPVVGDVDGNGHADIVLAVCAVNPGEPAGIYVFNRLGQRRMGWPVLEEYSFVHSPALGDLDRDGRLEIVTVHDAIDTELHVLQADGFEADGWPQKLFTLTSSRVGISIADVNNDELPEIVTSVPGYPHLTLFWPDPAYVGGITARDISGKIVSLNGNGFAQTLPFESVAQMRVHKSAPPVIFDLDGNGRLDVLLGSMQERTFGSLVKFKQRSTLYAWEIPSSGRVDWPMFRQNVANNGVYSLLLEPTPVPTNVTRAIRDRIITLEERDLRIEATTNDWNAGKSPLKIIGFTKPTNGTVTLDGETVLVYRPNTNFAAMDTFTYTVLDEFGTTSTAPIYVRVKPVNDPPVAEKIDLVMNKNRSVDVYYNGRDPEGATLSYRITVPPQNGELWNYPTVGTYYPKPGFSGTDSFSYVANDGRLDSLPATVTVTILNSNNPPKAASQNLLTKTNRALSINPGGSDPDGDPLTYELVMAAPIGTTIQEGSRFRYTPPQDFVGETSFSFRAFDGTAFSEDATVTIGVIATNAAPRAQEVSATVQPNSESVLHLAGNDPDGDQIAYEILSQPLHGTIYGTPPEVRYVPHTNYLGPDRFEFRVTDGFATSEAAVFLIQVTRQNRVPQANNQVVTTHLNHPVTFTINGSDPDGDPLQTIILKGPRNGLIYGKGTSFTYVPTASILGVDTFSYKLWDGQKFGNAGHVTVIVASGVEEKPPSFTSIRTLGRMVQLSLGIPEGKPFRLEASTNLVEWNVVVPTTTISGTNYNYQDSPMNSPRRYYRAIRE